MYHLLFEKIQDGATNKRNERIVAASVLKYWGAISKRYKISWILPVRFGLNWICWWCTCSKISASVILLTTLFIVFSGTPMWSVIDRVRERSRLSHLDQHEIDSFYNRYKLKISARIFAMANLSLHSHNRDDITTVFPVP